MSQPSRYFTIDHFYEKRLALSSPKKKHCVAASDDSVLPRKSTDSVVAPSLCTLSYLRRYSAREASKHDSSNASKDLVSTAWIKEMNHADTIPDKTIYSDRFIPFRSHNNWDEKFSLTDDEKDSNESTTKQGATPSKTYSCLLKNELLSKEIYKFQAVVEEHDVPKSNLFVFTSPKKKRSSDLSLVRPLYRVNSYSERLLRSEHGRVRKISNVPYKILDAPGLREDFYLNLLDWSAENVLAVALSSSVYLWSAMTAEVTELCNLAPAPSIDNAMSVSWNQSGNILAVGTEQGFVRIWDVTTNQEIMKYHSHTARVGVLAWNGTLLSSGSKDKSILQTDCRIGIPVRQLLGHHHEVCGLKWSADYQYLASGSNDNRLKVWTQNTSNVVKTFTEHKAAVKALAWSPFHHHILASGGGTSDHSICVWNILTGRLKKRTNTGSQICNMAWSTSAPEIVSTHGYSKNEIIVWKYPSMAKIAQFCGHSQRVLYMAMSPDGENIATGAGDEVIKFWYIFGGRKPQKVAKSVLDFRNRIR